MPGLNWLSLRRPPEPPRPRDRRKPRAPRLRRPDRRTSHQEHPDWCRLVAARRLETGRPLARRKAAHHGAARLEPCPGTPEVSRKPSRDQGDQTWTKRPCPSQEESPRCANTRGQVQPVTITKPKDKTVFHFNLIIARPSDIWATATSRVSGMAKGRRYARALSANIRSEARQRGVRYGTLRRNSGLARVRFGRLWFSGNASIPDVLRVHAALGCSVESIWAVR